MKLSGGIPLLTMTSLALSAVVFTLTQVSPPEFVDLTQSSRLGFVNNASHTSRKYLPEAMVGGVAMLDYNNDGLIDLFFVNGAALKDPMSASSLPDKSDPKFWNRLYRNNGDGTFTDVTQQSGVKGEGFGMGAAVGDFDNDGWPDLYVTSVGRNTLYHNNRDGTFVDVTQSAGVAGNGWSAGAMFVDYDRDGKLDLFVSRYLEWNFSDDVFCGQASPGGRAYCHPDQFLPATHLLFHNDGQGHFHDVSEESGISKSPGKGLGVAFADYDHDGWPDIFVANDSVAQQLFHNLKNGRFEEVAVQSGLAFDEDGHPFSGMGIDVADFDNIGRSGVFVNALAKQKYALYRNHAGSFDYVSSQLGIAAASIGHSGWGAKFIDYDNDGLKDLFIAQGHVMDNIKKTQPDVNYFEPPMLLHNEPPLFVDVSGSGGAVFSQPKAARGAAFGYLSNNGLIDIAINCNDQPAVLLHMMATTNHWLLINTVGTTSNRDGIGAELHLVTEDGKQQFSVVTTAGSYLSSSDKRVHFGMGSNRKAKLLEIRWPSGITQTLTNIAANQLLVVREPAP